MKQLVGSKAGYSQCELCRSTVLVELLRSMNVFPRSLSSRLMWGFFLVDDSCSVCLADVAGDS